MRYLVARSTRRAARSFSTGIDRIRSVIIIGVLALLTCTAAAADIKHPISEINVADLSVPYRTALRLVGRFPASVQLAFLGDDHLAIASHDGTAVPRADVLASTFHLTIDILALDSDQLGPANQLRFDTDTVDSRIAALPSGRLIVDTGRELLVLDGKQQMTAQATAAQVCGVPAGFPAEGPYRTALFAGSEEIGVIGFERPGQVTRRLGRLPSLAGGAGSRQPT